MGTRRLWLGSNSEGPIKEVTQVIKHGRDLMRVVAVLVVRNNQSAQHVATVEPYQLWLVVAKIKHLKRRAMVHRLQHARHNVIHERKVSHQCGARDTWREQGYRPPFQHALGVAKGCVTCVASS